MLWTMTAGEAAQLRQLGPYRIVRRLGAGGMAEVHLARRFGASGWEKMVAIKVLRAEQRGHVDLERLLIAEARLGARFDHPGLVAVHDLGLTRGIYFVCMDYVDGGDLRSLLCRRSLPHHLALYIGEKLAAALAYVHSLTDSKGRALGLVHRDVSPGNVLLSRSGAVKLSDFGIAKATAAADRTWGRLHKGKYAYMAPEQIVGAPLSGSADIFALGVTLHELLLGRRPFDRVIRPIRPIRPTHPNHPNRPNRPNHSVPAEAVEPTDRAEIAEPTELAELTERPELAERPELPERPGRPDHPEHPKRPEPERPGQTHDPAAEGPLATMEAIRRAELPADHDFDGLSPGVIALLRRCLAREPDDRYQSAALLAHALAVERRQLPIAGALDLAAWVASVAEEEPQTGTIDEPATLGMDELEDPGEHR